jgi:predicted RNA-binding Zn-ribbon protein involved in translation (DUF1610 family)
MALFASFTGIKCPNCGMMVMAYGKYEDLDEPRLDVTKCQGCGAELQIRTDPKTGKTRAERVKKN